MNSLPLISLLLLSNPLIAATETFPGSKMIPERILNSKTVPVIGTGNPAVTKHAMTKEACRQKLKTLKVSYENSLHEKICGGPYMAPLYDPAVEPAEKAKACIDKFEYPNLPCEYPVIWVRASEAAEICEAQGKRICDAHEWEGACAGRLLPPDYAFSTFTKLSETARIKARRQAKNRKERSNKTWSYGKTRQKGICGMSSYKSKGCAGGGWQQCGSNTYPVGAFPKCRSDLDVYDIHGNAAEHMNLPVTSAQMASTGSKILGYTEMKGSWFIFDGFKAHQDHCRWRAPFWHGSKLKSETSHRNYHLGFRCCKTL